MLDGKLVLPASDAFGACFRRTTRPLRRYELGFDPAVLADRKRIVRGLVSNSAAERAGLRNGDEIVMPFGQDAVQGDQSGTLTVEVRRDGEALSDQIFASRRNGHGLPVGEGSGHCHQRLHSMSISRRTLLLGAATAPVVSKSLAAGPQPVTSESFALPAKKLFASMPYTYLDSGSTHPLSLGAKAALEDYLRSKTRDAAAPAIDMDAKQESVMRRFATLVGAHPEELCFVQSTTMGENLVIQALGLPARGGRIVTDALHFFGSFYTYGELGKAGMDVVTLRMTKEGAIDLNEMADAIDERTRLVAVSLVSTINGYEHDLKRVCEIAHARGAHVYADIVHAAGAIPVNLHESGVDFAACSSYKWLMGDFGLGFLYVRKDLQEKIRRPWWGYHQLASFATHVYPHDAPGSAVADYAASPDASGQFAMGTFSYAGVMLARSFPGLAGKGGSAGHPGLAAADDRPDSKGASRARL